MSVGVEIRNTTDSTSEHTSEHCQDVTTTETTCTEYEVEVVNATTNETEI